MFAATGHNTTVVRALRGIFLIALVGTIAGAGCVPPHIVSQFSPAQEADAFEEGVTTRTEVVELLGQPKWTSDGERTFHYWGGTIDSVGAYFAPVPILLKDRVPVHKHWYLQVTFDEKNRVKSAQGWEDDQVKEALMLQAQRGDRGAAYQLTRPYREFGPLLEMAKRGDLEALFELTRHYDGVESLREANLGHDVDRALCARYNTYQVWWLRDEIQRRGLLTETELAASSKQKQIDVGMSECAMLVRLGPVKDGDTHCGRLETLSDSSGIIRHYIYKSCGSELQTVVGVQDGRVLYLRR